MSDAWAYVLGMSAIITVLFAAMGLVRVIWWAGQLLRAKTVSERLEAEMMRRELMARDGERKAGFHGR